MKNLEKKIKKAKVFKEMKHIAEELVKELVNIKSHDNGMDHLVPVFKEVVKAQKEVFKLGDIKKIENLNFLIKKKREKFIKEFSKFLKEFDSSQNGWNRTPPGEIPSAETIFVKISDPLWSMELKEKSVAEYLEKRKEEAGKLKNLPIKDWERRAYNETRVVEIAFVNRFLRKKYKTLVKMLLDLKNNQL